MAPVLLPGDRVLIHTDCNPESLHAGELAAFRLENDCLVLHRFTSRTDKGLFVTQGDNGLNPDPPWTASQFVGRVIASKTVDGHWRKPSSWSRHPIRLLKQLTNWDLAKLPRKVLTPVFFGHLTEAPFGGRGAMAVKWEAQELGTELVLYDPERGDVHVLNQTAGKIWKALSAGDEPAKILKELQAEYPEVGEEQLAADLDSAVKHLKHAGLIF